MTDTHDEWQKLNPVPSNRALRSATTKRAALYARVATVSQADGSSAIEEQKRAIREFCRESDLQIVAEYIEAPGSGADANRSGFQRMVEDALRGVPGFEVVVVYSDSRFFRDLFLGELYRRRLSQAGIELVSVTEEFSKGLHVDFVRQVIGLMGEYQSRENAKLTLRGMKENARQGFVNGSPPFGYRAVVAETRLGKVKKRLEIEPSEAEIVKLIFRLAMVGPTGNGLAGATTIARELNRQNLKTRSGQPFSSGRVNQILHRTTYNGHHIFNLIEGRTKRKKPPDERVVISVSAIIDSATFESAQAARRAQNPFSSQPGENGPAPKLNRPLGDDQ
jgi:site-specific DNA recombinase